MEKLQTETSGFQTCKMLTTIISGNLINLKHEMCCFFLFQEVEIIIAEIQLWLIIDFIYFCSADITKIHILPATFYLRFGWKINIWVIKLYRLMKKKVSLSTKLYFFPGLFEELHCHLQKAIYPFSRHLPLALEKNKTLWKDIYSFHHFNPQQLV